MASQELYEKFSARLGETVPENKTAFVNALLDEAEDKVLDYIGRGELPERLTSFVVKLAVIAYNMAGSEGESSRTEGGISRAFDAMPEDDKARLANYKRKVGVIHAADDA